MVWKASNRLRAVAGWARVGWEYCRRSIRLRSPFPQRREAPPIHLVVAARRSAQWQSIDAQLAALRESPVETDAAA
jgi:hypothetical protein